MPVLRLMIFALIDGLAGSFRRLFNSSINRRLTERNLRKNRSNVFDEGQRTGFELRRRRLQHRDRKLFDN